MKQKLIYVFLGRFAPIQKGHQLMIDKMIEEFGINNCLLVIGSSTSLNNRTPFTFVARKKMIKILYPNIKTVGLPDTHPELVNFDNFSIDAWIKDLKNIEFEMNAHFVFCAGSSKDVKYLENDFETLIFVNRHKEGQRVSTTKVRKALNNKQTVLIQKYLDKRITNFAIREFEKFPKSSIK